MDRETGSVARVDRVGERFRRVARDIGVEPERCCCRGVPELSRYVVRRNGIV